MSSANSRTDFRDASAIDSKLNITKDVAEEKKSDNEIKILDYKSENQEKVIESSEEIVDIQVKVAGHQEKKSENEKKILENQEKIVKNTQRTSNHENIVESKEKKIDTKNISIFPDAKTESHEKQLLESRQNKTENPIEIQGKKIENEVKTIHFQAEKIDSRKESSKTQERLIEKPAEIPKSKEKKIGKEENRERFEETKSERCEIKVDNLEKKAEQHMKIIEMMKKQISGVQAKIDPVLIEKPEKTTNEIAKAVAPVNRDPRLKLGANASSNVTAAAQNKEFGARLAYKYNPKPKKQDKEVDLERNVAESIEKSMKISHVPLPPKATLRAPPAPPDDLFSPESPDEIDKNPIPILLNKMLLNSQTTGVINEVVSALQRSNENNLLLGNIRKNEAPHSNIIFDQQPLFNQFNQPSNIHFSPPGRQGKFTAGTQDSSIFVQPKPVIPPLMGVNAFFSKELRNEEMPVLDFQPPLDSISNFDRPANPPHLTPFEDRMGQKNFNLDRGTTFVPPSPSYVPPSPSYVPPSPIYEDNFRDMNTNTYHNYQDRSNPQAYFEKNRGPVNRGPGLLGDYPHRMQFENQYNQQNYDNFYHNQAGPPGGFMEPRKPFFGGNARDPRLNIKRGGYPDNDPVFKQRESRMTYREYKEKRDRETRERDLIEKAKRELEMRERALRDGEKNISEKSKAELEATERKAKEAKDKDEPGKRDIEGERRRQSDKDGGRERDSRARDQKHDDERRRDRSRDGYSRSRSTTRYRRDREEPRDKSRERPRFSESRFDKVYSSRDKDKEDFTSPLDSLYASSTAKTGKGYGIQFKIPKKPKEEDKSKNEDSSKKEEKSKKEERPKKEEEPKKEEKPKKDDAKAEKVDDSLKEESKIDVSKDKIEEPKKIESEIDFSKNKDLKKEKPRRKETKMQEPSKRRVKKPGKKTIAKFEEEEDESESAILENVADSSLDPVKIEDQIEEKVKDEIELSSSTVEEPIEEKVCETLEPAKQVENPPEEKPEEAIEKPEKKCEEEESILTRFFQNLMKSSNKDEKKGALLSLISTFSDSFSDQQLKRITTIIRSEDSVEEEQESSTKIEEHEVAKEVETEVPSSVEPEALASVEPQALTSVEPQALTSVEPQAPTSVEPQAPTSVEPQVPIPEEEKKEENVNEQTNSEETIEEELEMFQKKTDDDLVQVSVGERIKNRKRAETPRIKGKAKTELDRLHEDIREMFIRDGVVTASGKRMCRILKDTTTSPVENEKKETKNTDEEPKKTVPIGKKKGKKAVTKATKDTVDIEMRELSVILPKMSFENITPNNTLPDKRYSLRKVAKTTNYNENETENDTTKEIEKKKVLSENESTDKESEDETNSKETENSNTAPGGTKKRIKKRGSWYTGVIKKKNYKNKKVKSPQRNTDDTEETNEQHESPLKSLSKKQLSQLHEKEYFMSPDQTNLQCKICDVSTKWIAAHYKSAHPDMEVFSSRPSPEASKLVIADALCNKETYEEDGETSVSKHEYSCIFCDYKAFTLPRLFRDHVSIHTGEFRHKCPHCNFKRAHVKSVHAHVMEVHGSEEAASKKRIYSQPAIHNKTIFAHICEACNYTQMSLENVKEHIKVFHSGSKKIKIHKINLCIGKSQKSGGNDSSPSPVKDRPRRTKASQANNTEAEDEKLPELDTEVGTPSKDEALLRGRTEKHFESPPILTKEIDEPSEASITNDTTVDSDQSETTNTSMDFPARRRTRKRRKSFVAPKPSKRRTRTRSTRSVVSNTDTETESESKPKEDEPDEVKEPKKIASKKVDEAVFTCNTDLNEENKRIAEERLKTMQDINSTIKLRTTLDFVEKLSNRLKLEEEVIVKQEVEEFEQPVDIVPPNELPVFEKSARDFEPTMTRPEGSPKTVKDVGGKLNPICGVIEKLQGILSNPVPTSTDSGNPPPMRHIDQVERKPQFQANSEVLNIGPLKVFKSAGTFLYSCCSPPCILSTRDLSVFRNHCEVGHEWNANMDKFPNCLACGEKLQCDERTSLLTFALDHSLKEHAEFTGIKIGSIRVSSNLFPNAKPDVEDTDEDRSDAQAQDRCVTTPPTISIPSPLGDEPVDDIDRLLSSETIPQDFEEENPFSFKIVDVVSLASENEVPPLTLIGDQSTEVNKTITEASPKANIGKKSPVKTYSIFKDQATSKTIITPKYVSLKWRKSQNTLKKFLGAHNDLYKCPEFTCLFTTNRRKMFDIHITMHSDKNPKSCFCLYCDKTVSLSAMADHYENVHGMCRFSCCYCLYRCIAKDYMDIHQILMHNDLPSRMQLLPKRDFEEKKNSISILSEATKNFSLPTYRCCDREFLFTNQFVNHVKFCKENVVRACLYQKNQQVCNLAHKNVDDLLKHWGEKHGVYPLKCAYCEYGREELKEVMIHLVTEHPTLPPDVLDRSTFRPKTPTTPARAQCNFQTLAINLRNDPLAANVSASFELAITHPSVVTTIPQTMQGAFETFLKTPLPVSVASTVNYPKITPVSLVNATTSGISLLKATSKANVLASGGVVYCLAPSNQSQLFKAVMVNTKDKSSVVPPVKLLSPVNMPAADSKFQIVKGLRKVIPLAPTVPMLSPIGQRVVRLPLVVGEMGVPTRVEENEVEAGDGDVNTPGDLGVGVEETTTPLGGVVVGESQKEAMGDEVMDVNLPNLEEPMMVIDDDFDDKEVNDARDPLSLEIEDPLSDHSSKYSGNESFPGSATPLHEYDSDFKDTEHQEDEHKTGLIGYQLYRCAKCDLSFSDHAKFKDHVIKSVQCRYDNAFNKPYKCVHCGKMMKHYSNLLDHLGYHGHLRFLCSLCNNRFPHSSQARYHMKVRHNILTVNNQPLIPHKNNLNHDEFVVKPQGVATVKPTIKETAGEGDVNKSSEVKTVYYSHEADDIPQKSILSYDITCGHCKKFKNKVRSNIVRHLLLHQNDQDFTVPDTAPVNPVPCLEKNEKMFDKMYNLASSSHAGGRMGGHQKNDGKKLDKEMEEDYPAFIPSNKRFSCCSVGCTYLCLGESNLRHHLTALHSDDPNFVCVHCKRDLSDAADVDTILKHLKLHELHLYKCGICEFLHNLKHKVERHIAEKHKNKDCSVVVLRAMDAEPYDENHQSLAPFPVVMNQKSTKPWRCCMCKYRCYTQEEAALHAENKHHMDCRYKCALCSFKCNAVHEFPGHFKSEHPDTEIDIILVYQKEEEPQEAVSDQDQFDTTPLWRRDKPRVRHIRGILFDENSPVKKKNNTMAKNQQHTTSFDQTASITPPAQSPGKKRKRSASVFSEALKEVEEDQVEDVVEKKKDLSVSDPLEVKTPADDLSVIVIEDDEDPIATAQEQSVDESSDDIELLCRFGDLGMPLNKNFKCPKCEKFRTTKMRDFIQHVAQEISYHRFSCSICSENFVTLESFKMHCIDYHDCSTQSIVALPVHKAMNRWLTMLLQGQRTIMMNLGFNSEEPPEDVEDFLRNHSTGSGKPSSQKESAQKPMKCNECGFHVSGPQAMNRHLKYNHPHIAFGQSTSGSSSPQPANQQPEAGPSRKRPSDEPPAVADVKRAKNQSNLIAKDKYACSLCTSIFDSVPEMEFHATEAHDGNISYAVQTIEMPMAFEYGRNIFRCSYCPTTGSKASLEIHFAQDHPGHKLNLYKFLCGVCPAKFETIKTFRKHFKTHDLAVVFYFDVYDKKVNVRTRAAAGSASKTKIYSCPVCSYVRRAVNPSSIKTHLKIHAKPFRCELCMAQFKYRPEAHAHHQKEHPHHREQIEERPEMLEKIARLIEEVMQTAQTVEEKMLDEEEDEPQPVTMGDLLTITPDIHLDHHEEETVDVDVMEGNADLDDLRRSAQPAGKVAKKSTGRVAKKVEIKDYYSYYGKKPDPVNMSKILTTLEVADAELKMTCDQLGRIYNLNPLVMLNDCIRMVVEDDDAS